MASLQAYAMKAELAQEPARDRAAVKLDMPMPVQAPAAAAAPPDVVTGAAAAEATAANLNLFTSVSDRYATGTLLQTGPGVAALELQRLRLQLVRSGRALANRTFRVPGAGAARHLAHRGRAAHRVVHAAAGACGIQSAAETAGIPAAAAAPQCSSDCWSQRWPCARSHNLPARRPTPRLKCWPS